MSRSFSARRRAAALLASTVVLGWGCDQRSAGAVVPWLQRTAAELRAPLDTTADLVVGQLGVTYGQINQTNAVGLYVPDGAALDISVSPPRFYVADTSNNRVLAWANASSFASGAPADRVFGQPDAAGHACNLGNAVSSPATLCSPKGVTVDASGNLFVADTGNSRVLRYNTPFVQDSLADLVFGQISFTGHACNQGATAPTATKLCQPTALALDPAGNLYVADTNNNRVVRYDAPLVTTFADAAELVLGEGNATTNSPNMVDARGLGAAVDVAVDRSVSPNRLFVVDQDNHRILGWSDAQAFADGDPATLVIGQPDFNSNAPNRGGTANDNTLNTPGHADVDTAGRLYVADTGNHRVLRFDAPFTIDTIADKVWGQANFTAVATCPRGIAGFCSPWGVAVSPAGDLYVADSADNRILKFTDSVNGDATADQVIGQPDYVGYGCNQGLPPGATTLCNPTAVTFDPAGDLFVADAQNNRVLTYLAPLDSTADRVFGQSGSFTTAVGATTASGLRVPWDVAIDPGGDLWIADGSNYRYLGYSTPLADQTADVVLGQPNFTTAGCGPVSATCSGFGAVRGLGTDGTGNVFVAEETNHRALEFFTPIPSTPAGIVADKVLGQMTKSGLASNSLDAAGFNSPRGIAMDTSAGPARLFVADTNNNRVLGWSTLPTTNGQASDLLVGQPSYIVNAAGNGATGLSGPRAVAAASGNLYVADTGNHRVLEFDSPFSSGVSADRVLGQATTASGTTCNQGLTSPTSATLCTPAAVVADNAQNVWITDASNHRVLRYDAPWTTDRNADAALGQVSFTLAGINLVEAAGLYSPAGVAIDRSQTPNRLYVVDTNNSRVLGWPDTQSFASGAPATLVIGQSGMNTFASNSPSISASTLALPRAAAVDAQGRLYVADYGNHRILIYTSPFTTDGVADRVIGQATFTTGGAGASATALNGPEGMALDSSDNLWVADRNNNRVLYYVSPATTDSVADAVIGQANFTATSPNRGGAPAADTLSSPDGVAFDASPTPRLYVADSTNNRALAYDSPLTDGVADQVFGQATFNTTTSGTGGPAGLATPQGIAVDLLGNVYVAATSSQSSRVVQYNSPRTTDALGDVAYGQYDINSSGTNQPVAVGLPTATNLSSPFGLAFDSQNNLYVADMGNHRVTVYFANNLPVANALTATPGLPYTNDALAGAYSYFDGDGDAESGTVITWYKNGVAQAISGLTVAANLTSRDESWYFAVRPKDGQSFGAWATSNTVVIQNSVPTATGLQISPVPAYTADALNAAYSFADADGDAESGSDVRWFRNGIEVPAYRGSLTVSPAATSKGETWFFSVSPSDGTVAGSDVSSPPVAISNTAPTASGLSISPPSPLGGSALAATYAYADADTDAEATSRVRWYRNSTLVAAYNDSKTVPAGIVVVGESWSYTLEPSDGTDFGPLFTSPTVVVGSNAPVASALSIAPNPAYVTIPLSRVYTYSDPDGDAESGTVTHWYKNGALQGAYDNQALIPTSQLVKGNTWYFTVQPRDVLGTVGTLATSPTITVANSPPAATGVTLSPPTPDTSATLQAAWTYSDPNGDAQGSAVIRWYRNGIEVAALANATSAPASYTAKGQSWYFTVAPTDGTDLGAAIQSNTVVIANAAPLANAGPNQAVVPTQATERITLTGTASTDPDGDVLSYAWAEGATALATGSVVGVDLAVGVHTITLTVSDGAAIATDTVVIDIANPQPTASISTGVSAPPGRVALIGSGSDPLGRSLSYQWTQLAGDPVTITGPTQSTASYFATASGPRQFQLVVTAGGLASLPATVTVTTLNVAPFAAALPRKIAPTGVAVQLDGIASADPNGDALTYQWSLDPAGATTAAFDDPTSPTPTLTASLDGRYLVRLVVSDGAQDSVASVGEVLVIDAALAQHVPVANAGSDAFADVGKSTTLDGRLSYDIDGDPLSYSWRQVSGPSGDLQKATTAQPTFRPSAAGAVVLGLIVGDGKVQSAEDTVTLNATDPLVDSRPIARAQGDATAVVGGTAQLDGARSIDPDGDALTYHWTQVDGVQVTLSNNTSPTPSFVPLQPGVVRFELEVSDGTLTSAQSSVTVLVTRAPNRPPVANAGPDQAVQTGTGAVTLDGSMSSDPDGDVLSYVWEQITGPPVVLAGPVTGPAFTPPGLARYRFRLVVRDAEAPSLPDEVEVAVATHGANNQQPIANAGADQDVPVGTLVQLDGSASSDADPLDKLSYEWSFVAFPTGNEPTLNSASIAQPTFSVAVPGPYTLRLVVSDGDLASAPAYVTITAESGVAAQGCSCDHTGWAPLAMLGALAARLGTRRPRRWRPTTLAH